ncbi:hypothetical protein [Yinghuangia seranimata]|uniref:hypothetical protein n=1 Tax=Yinghuangia seranimata TaxID=408067 RepID=UPI00248C066C|nr:hypothetical protein [Yinghuangia seranimata]MDI2130200.1 hypothetical protein [Yinghuangia seranimata]
MTAARPAALAGALLTTVLAGCGVQPTPVIDAGVPAGGLTQGMRLYFASAAGLRAAPRPDLQITELSQAVSALQGGPDAAEAAAGMYNTAYLAAYTVTSDQGQVTLSLGKPALEGLAEPAVGQLVCTLARAESYVNRTRPDEVQVTIVSGRTSAGPYQCPQFLPR